MIDHSNRPVRTRFAPSPTGSLHIGGLRTALFNWLFARRHGGAFILRIEDTDQKRYDPTALATLTEALRWAGLQWDEGPEVDGPCGPYIQSERLALYQEWAQWLVDHDSAYRCFCSPERLAKVSHEKDARREQGGYDRHCRNLTPRQIADFEAQGIRPVIRFKMPLDGETIVHDVIRGEIRFDNSTQQDMVLLKSDGFPTYHLAHVVDDYLMRISHVMRANEWLPSFPLHAQIWRAFGWEMPQFVHLPVMLNPNGKGKMSKRNPPKDKYGKVIPVLVHDYIQAGYLPEAMDNFLANIGWNFGDEREFFTMAEAMERFALDRINPANSAFPIEKLDWLNGEHIRALAPEELARRIRPRLEAAGLRVDEALLNRIVPLVQTRLKTLNEIVDVAGFFFHESFQPAPPDDLIQDRMDVAGTRAILDRAHAILSGLDDFSHDTQEAAMRALSDELGIKPKQLFGTLRVAVTGQRVATPLFETMEILGKDVVLNRLTMASESLLVQS